MKYRILTCFAAITLFAALAVPVRLAAQGQQQTPPNYTVTDLGTLGGPFSMPGGINNHGGVSGYSLLPDYTFHAFLWQNGDMTDVGTLGGPNSFALYRPNESGAVGGASDTTTPDPHGEDWCGIGTGLICHPFIWRDGEMTALPTLGGNNGQANGVNSQGQVVGMTEYQTQDPTCPAGSSMFLIGAVVWERGEHSGRH
jgi:probable HAF family extracellular repeat protein